MAITESEFAEKIKIKYPQYKDIDDSELVSRVLDKYPEYSSQLGEKEYSKNLITNSAKSVVSGGVQAAINAGAGVAQSYAMLLGDESDTSEEGIQEYLSQRRVQPRRGGSRMTAGKILAHRKRKNEVLQSLNENAHRLRALANGIDEQFNIDPEFANSFVGQVSKGFGQMIGNIGAVAVGTVVAGPKGGIAAATGAIAPQMVSEAVNDAESTLGKSYMDMTEEEKDQVALATAGYATLGTAFEFAPVARIPWVKNFLKGKTKVPAGVLKSPRIRKEIAKGFAAEGFTEAAQGQLLDSLARATFDDDRELMSWDVLRQRFNEFAVGGVVGGGTSGGIATVQRAARGELFKPKETKEVQSDGTTKEVFDITYTDRNTNEPVTIQIDAENQEDAARIAGERLVTSAVEGTIVARPKPAPEPVTQPEPGITVEDEPTEAEQAELQQELQEELDQPDATAEASVTFMPRRFVGEDAETAPGFFQQFSPQQYDDGRFINVETKEDLSDETFEGGSIRIEQGRPVLETSDNPSDTIINKKASEEGSLVRTNLFKQKAGWKWTKAPEGAPSTIVSVEQGSKHFYTLDFTSSKPLTLKTYPEKTSEPRGRPTTRGKVQLGKTVGEIDIRGKKHPVYDRVTVGEPDVTAGAAPVGTPQMSAVSDANDALRVGTSKKGTKARPVETKQTDNIDSNIIPDATLKQQMEVVNYPSLPKSILNEKDPKAKYEKFVNYIRDNLIALYNKFPADLRATATQWYDGANKIATDFASKYNITSEQASAILAVFSPQKDWFMNVAQAEQLLHIMQNYQDTVMEGAAFDAEVDSAVEASRQADLKEKVKAQISKRGYDTKTARVVRKKLKARIAFQRRKLLEQLKGKTIRELLSSKNESDRYLAGWGIRLLAQEKFGRYYNIINPNGNPMGLSPKKDGTPAMNTWGSIGEITKAVSILQDGSLRNISEQLGTEHKVRNFYNNIVAPNSPLGDVTIDTHAVAAGLLLPMGASGIPVKHNFGSGISGSRAKGISGIYHAYLAAYRKAAADVGIQPRQMQSITWEAIRLLFPSDTRGKEAIDKITNIHNKYDNAKQAREEILRPEIPGPSWSIPTGTREPVNIPENVQAFGSDNVLGGDLRFRGRRTVGRTDPEVTAQAAPIEGQGQQTPSQAEASRIQKFIESTFGEIVSKIGTSISVNPNLAGVARYNANTGVIEINPARIVELQAAGQIDIVDDAYIKSMMREEMIHAAMSKVILKKAKGKKEGEAFRDFMDSLGKSLTPQQRQAIEEVYQGLETDADFGAEYSRAAIQQLLYGNVTESFITEGRAFDKIKKLLKSVQAYVAKTFKADVTTDPEAAGIIVETARLLQSVDPDAKLVEQKVVNEAMAYSEDVNPNGEITSQQVAQLGKPPSEKKLNINFARKYLLTVSSLLNSIHPRLKALIRNYYGNIQREVLDYQKRVAPFFKKYRGIRNTKDRRRLKTLLLYSPVEQEGVDPLIEERDALLRKYDLFNDYQLEIRPVLNELYSRLNNEGIIVGYLEQYFPRSINDLDKVKNRAGKELRDAFREFVKDRNKKIEDARKRIDEGNPRRGDAELAKERTVQIGDPQTAALEAQQWDQFTRGFNLEGRRNLPGNFLSRTEELNVIPDELLDAYDDPGVSMERYIYNTVTAIQTTRLMGSKFANVPKGLKVPPASELGLLIQELKANGEISVEDADQTVPDIFAFILSPMQMENVYFQLARTFGYGTLLVEFTSTLSQLYDLPFIMLDNGIFGTAVAMFGPRLKGEDFGIDVNQVSAEFAGDNRVLEKAVRLGLRATGFTKLDQVMKETNMTANYNRYRKLARGYYKDRNSANSKKFIAELTSMGYSAQEQTQLIADLKSGNRDSAYIRTLLFNKLSETQPLTQAEMAMGIVGNPNLRFFVAMKSFMIKQLNFVRDRMVLEFIDGVRTGNAQKIKKASKDMALLMTFMLMIGLPVDALKDFLAGRLGYMSDYLFNGVFRIFGVSRYTAYQFRKEGAGEALRDYFTPVAFQQFYDLTGELSRVTTGERALTESKFVQILPFSDVINRIFGFQKERERKEFRRRIGEGERPFLVPPGAI